MADSIGHAMTKGANNTHASADMPMAIVWPHMRRRTHECRATPDTGPCPHPHCGRGHHSDLFIMYFLPQAFGSDWDKLDPDARLPIGELKFRRVEWRADDLSVWIWQELRVKVDEPAPPPTQPPPRVMRALPEHYIDTTWTEVQPRSAR